MTPDPTAPWHLWALRLGQTPSDKGGSAEGQWGQGPGGAHQTFLWSLLGLPHGSGLHGVTDTAEQGRAGQYRAASVARRGEALPRRPAGERGLGTPVWTPPPSLPDAARGGVTLRLHSIAPQWCPSCPPAHRLQLLPTELGQSRPPSPQRALGPSLWWPISLQTPVSSHWPPHSAMAPPSPPQRAHADAALSSPCPLPTLLGTFLPPVCLPDHLQGSGLPSPGGAPLLLDPESPLPLADASP